MKSRLEKAMGYIQGKLNCMNKCDVFEREDSENKDLCDNCEYCYSQGNFGNQKEAFQMAINALEKQIPKKPKMRHIEKYDGYNDGWCSCCEAYVIEENNKNFCSECGQKLDWSDNNDE